MLANWISYLVAGSIVATLVSIAASGILFGAALFLWLVKGVRERRFEMEAPPFAPAFLLILLTVLVAVVFSEDPARSSVYLTRMIRLLPVFWIYTFLSRNQVRRTFLTLVVVLGASALMGILQYCWLLDVTLVNRIRGFMSHWMTFSGQLMLGTTALGALLLFGHPLFPRFAAREKTPGPARLLEMIPWIGIFVLLGGALLLTFTRNAWLGTFGGFVCLLLWKGRRWFLLLLAAVMIAVLLLPGEFSDRLSAGFDPGDTTNQGRVELFQTGLRMILDHPLTGVGPRMVPVLASRYAKRFQENEDFPRWLYQHLHNTPIQIAAETGLFGLVSWLLLWAVLFRDFWRFSKHRSREIRFFAINGFAVLVAFLMAGLFEYNLGDSEILTLLLFFVTAPYVAIRDHLRATA